MPDLKDFALCNIDWNLTPEHAVTMYLEWGNNDWHAEYPPVRSKEDVSHYLDWEIYGLYNKLNKKTINQDFHQHLCFFISNETSCFVLTEW